MSKESTQMKDIEFTSREWKELKSSQKQRIMSILLNDIIVKIIEENVVDEAKINRCLLFSVPLSIEEIINLDLCQHFSFISSLIRKIASNNRIILKDLDESMHKFEEKLFNTIEKEVEVYRKLEFQDGQTSQEENEKREKEEITREQAKRDKRKDKQIRTEEKLTWQNGNSHPITFERKTRN